MPRYKLSRDYGNDKFFGKAGDIVDIDADEFDRLEVDSPGTFEAVDAKRETPTDVNDLTAEDVLSEEGAAIKSELEAQIPTIDLDPEDKAKEIPGEGNKYTPASGYNANPVQAAVRVVERAPNDRQQKGGAKRSGDDADPGATSPDTSANARVTDQTPASAAANERQLAGGVLAHAAAPDDDAEAKKAAAEDARRAPAANTGTINSADFKATKKG